MAGLLSSLFDSNSSTDSSPDSNKAYAQVSPDDNFDDDGGTQGTQSFNPDSVENPSDGGAGDAGGPVGPPTDAYLEPQSGSGDADASF